jgi:hypothetical protein
MEPTGNQPDDPERVAQAEVRELAAVEPTENGRITRTLATSYPNRYMPQWDRLKISRVTLPFVADEAANIWLQWSRPKTAG